MQLTKPVVLGFDTSGPYCSAAVFVGNDVVSASYEDMQRGQAERLMPILEDVLADAGLNWSELSALGVGVGPGNFTGIRISVAAARGLALGLGIPAVGVSLLDALAFGSDRPVLSCIDARRESAYILGHHGASPPEITHVNIDTLDLTLLPEGTVVIGSASQAIETRHSIPRHPAVYAPASAIARIAAQRFGPNTPAPKPLYIRAADAAPSKERGPVMLP
jgi:tRNA threonylcarbamoyladenosine biosynthesis protein TsaB